MDGQIIDAAKISTLTDGFEIEALSLSKGMYFIQMQASRQIHTYNWMKMD